MILVVLKSELKLFLLALVVFHLVTYKYMTVKKQTIKQTLTIQNPSDPLV